MFSHCNAINLTIGYLWRLSACSGVRETGKRCSCLCIIPHNVDTADSVRRGTLSAEVSQSNSPGVHQRDATSKRV